MSESTLLRHAGGAPPIDPHEHAVRRKRVVLFDQILRDPELPRALQAAGFEVLPKRVLSEERSQGQWPELILAEIGELTAEDRMAVERARDAAPGLLVIGIGTPVVVALSKGRRNAYNSPERRSGAKRHVFDDFMSAPFDVSSLVYWLQAWELAAAVREQAKRGAAVSVSSVQALAQMGGSAMLEELVTPSTRSVQESLATIKQALVNRDSPALRSAAHHLQSTSGVFGAARMTQIAVLLESMGEAGCQDGASLLADSLEAEVGRFTKDLQALARSLGSGKEKAVPRQALNLRGMAPAFEGRSIASFGLDSVVTERLDTLIRSVHASFAVITAERCADGSWMKHFDLLILSVGREDVAEIDGVRQVFATERTSPIVVHLRDRSKELLELAALADDVVAAPGDVNEVMLAAHRVLVALDTAPVASSGTRNGNAKPAGFPGESKPRLLVAEDEALTARFLTSSLEAAGFLVTYAPNGADALDALARQRFDGALLDINMPEADGFAVLEHVRKDPLNRDMPVLMLSIRTQERDILKAFDLGADDYVLKPFSPPEVVLRLRKLVGKTS